MKCALNSLFIIVVSCLCVCGGTGTVVTTSKGRVRGAVEQDAEGSSFFAFYGIPFAKPPLGKLRFKEPVEFGRWDDEIRESTYKPKCIQPNYGGNTSQNFVGDEDCLYLNVFSKMHSKEVNLPVIVSIHGGSFEMGGSDECGPKMLMREEIVFISIAYRLNVFGFLSTEEDVLPGNQGLKDQNLALQWVKENIDAFGGDPNRITIAGFSAGGASAHYHMFFPKSSGLFNSVISQSGNVFCPWASGENHRRDAEEMGRSLGCPLKFGSNKFLNCLQKLDAKTILDYFLSQSDSSWGVAQPFWKPRVDGDFLPDEPVTLLKTGNFIKANVLMGSVKDEAAVLALNTLLDEMKLTNINDNFEKYGPISLMLVNEDDALKLAQKIYSEYLGGQTVSKDKVDPLIKMFSDRFNSLPYEIAALAHAEYAKENKLYLYELKEIAKCSINKQLSFLNAEVTEFAKNIINNYVGHSSDFHLTYNFFDNIPEDANDKRISKILTSAYANFSRIGDPTPGCSSFKWERVSKTNMKQLAITQHPQMEPMDKKRKEKLEFWANLNLKKNIFLSALTKGGKEKKDEF